MLSLQMVSLFAQEAPLRLELVSLDASSFPIVRVTLLTAGSQGAPLDNMSLIALHENGVPVTDFSTTPVPGGADFIFVLDANTDFEQVDGEDGESRLEKVAASIVRFATHSMNKEGLDRVSIMVPDEQRRNGRFLIQNAIDPQEVIDAIAAYQPQNLGFTPLNVMIDQALNQAAEQDRNGRFQALLLYTDAGRIDQQLSYPLLTAKANDIGAPIYAAILGAEADDNEISNVNRLTAPTQALAVHIPQPEGTDPIYRIWQAQSNPLQVQYRSLQRQSGRNIVTVNLGDVQVRDEFDVSIAAPEVALRLDRQVLRRVGSAHDTPLAALQPAVQPVKITLAWPDGLPRQLTSVALSANSEPLPAPDNLVLDAANELTYLWNVQQFSQGSVLLEAVVTDELGYEGKSDPLTIAVEVQRPLPPTPLPTSEPEETTTSPTGQLPANLGLYAAGMLILFLLLILLRRLHGRRQEKEEAARQALAAQEAATAVVVTDQTNAYLEWVAEGDHKVIQLSGNNIIFGRDPDQADVVLDDKSIARLHARIVRRDDTFILYDEGSANGTFHNYERIGLVPRPLQNEDIVQFGRLTFRFRR